MGKSKSPPKRWKQRHFLHWLFVWTNVVLQVGETGSAGSFIVSRHPLRSFSKILNYIINISCWDKLFQIFVVAYTKDQVVTAEHISRPPGSCRENINVFRHSIFHRRRRGVHLQQDTVIVRAVNSIKNGTDCAYKLTIYKNGAVFWICVLYWVTISPQSHEFYCLMSVVVTRVLPLSE